MRFEFWTKNRHSYIRANFEKDDSYIGNRQEGAGSQIEYNGEVIGLIEKYQKELSGLHFMLMMQEDVTKPV